jgi:hypothetical protein
VNAEQASDKFYNSIDVEKFLGKSEYFTMKKEPYTGGE